MYINLSFFRFTGLVENTHTQKHKMSGAIGACAVLIFALFVTGYYFQNKLPPPKPKILGIDLGTTFSCVSTYEFKTGNVTVYPDEHGKKIIPSVVAILEDRILVG